MNKKYITPSVKVKEVKLNLLISLSNGQPSNDNPDNQFAKDNFMEFVGSEDSEE